MDPDLLKSLGQGGIAAALLAMIFYVGKSLIASVKELAAAIAEHTRVDLEHHAEVRETVVRLEARLDTLLEVTPVHGTKRPRTNPHGIPVGYYGPRKGTQSDE